MPSATEEFARLIEIMARLRAPDGCPWDREPPLDSAGRVRARWEEIKAQERGPATADKSVLGGIPRTLPALLRAYQIGLRAASVGFDWDRTADVVAKIREEVDELGEVAGTDP